MVAVAERDCLAVAQAFQSARHAGVNRGAGIMIGDSGAVALLSILR